MNHPVGDPSALSKGYGPPPTLSTKSNRDPRWVATVGLFAAACIALVLLTALSLFGIGNPTRAWQPVPETTPASLRIMRQDDTYDWLRFDALPPPPFIIETELNAATWGMWIRTGDEQVRPFLIDAAQQSIATYALYDWRPFIHVDSVSNRLVLRVGVEGTASWRINGELAWSGELADLSTIDAGVIVRRAASTDTIILRVYTQ